ncbi:unnamed protein product [Aphanomyces euteiches]
MTTERTWLDDLHLLIATDEQLQQELATVCELFDSDDSLSTVTDTTRRPETTTTAQSTDDDNGATKRKKRKPTYIRQQEEIRQLRQQVDHLTALLRARQTTDERTPPSEILPSWRKTAQSELAMKNKTLQENQHLRHAVGQHATFIEQMQQFFHKKPRLSSHIDLHSEEWQAYKLAAQASLRRAAIHAIADRQYHRMQSAMVQAGVFNCEKTLFTARAKRQPDQSYVVEIIHNIELDAPFRVVGAAAWRVFKGDFDFDLPLGADQTFTRMDPNTVYATFVQETSDCMECHSNMIRKHYREREMEVIVSRTVLDDAAVPYMTKGEIQKPIHVAEGAPAIKRCDSVSVYASTTSHLASRRNDVGRIGHGACPPRDTTCVLCLDATTTTWNAPRGRSDRLIASSFPKNGHLCRARSSIRTTFEG